MRRLRRLLLASTAAASLAACTPTLPELNAEEQWSAAISRFGLFPFYPLQEDVQVGDVFLFAPMKDGEPSADAVRFSMMRLGSLREERVIAELRNQGERRLRFATVERPAPSGASTPAPRPAAATRRTPAAGAIPAGTMVHDHTAKDELIRLRRVALPTMTVVRLTEAQLGGGGFFGNVGASLGIGSSGSATLTVSVSDTSELAIDASRAREVLLQEQARFLKANLPPDTLLHHIRQVRPDLVPAFCKGDFGTLNTAQVFVAVLYRLLYARGVDYAYRGESTFAAKLAADLGRVFGSEFGKTLTIPTLAATPGTGGASGAGAAQAAAGQAAPRPATEGAGASQDGKQGSPTPSDLAAREAALRKAIDTIKGAFSLGTGPGATAQLTIGQFGEVTLRDIFIEPMAVGAGNTMRFSIDRIADAYQDIPDTEPVGHRLSRDSEQRRMLNARTIVRENCQRALARPGQKPNEIPEPAIVQLIAHAASPPPGLQGAQPGRTRARSDWPVPSAPLPPMPRILGSPVQR